MNERAPELDPREHAKRVWRRRMAGLKLMLAGIGITATSILLNSLGDQIFSPLGIGMGFTMTLEGIYELMMGQTSPVKNAIQGYMKDFLG